MSDKKTIEFQGYSWEYNGGMCVVGVDTSDYDFITFRRKKPEEKKREGTSTSIKPPYADQLVPTYEAFEMLQRRLEELEKTVYSEMDRSTKLGCRLALLEAWRKAE